MSDSLKIGIIGAGIMGRRHAGEINANANTRLVAVADLDLEQAQEVAEMYDSKGYTNAEQMLEREDLDVVFISTPDPYHREPLLLVLQSGVKRIMLEKPFATTVDDAENMHRAAEEADATVYVTYGTRSQRSNAATRFVLEKGLIGKPNYASLRIADNITVPRKMWSDRSDNWASKSSSVHFLYSHRIDRLRWFYRPAEVETVTAVSRNQVLGFSSDFVESFLTWNNGLVTRVHTGWVDFGNQLVYSESFFQGVAGMITDNERPAFGRPTLGWQLVVEGIEFHELQLIQEEMKDRGIDTRLFSETHSDRQLPDTVLGIELLGGTAEKSMTDYIIDSIVEDSLCPSSWKQFQGSAPLPTAIDGLEQTKVCCAVEEAAASGSTQLIGVS